MLMVLTRQVFPEVFSGNLSEIAVFVAEMIHMSLSCSLRCDVSQGYSDEAVNQITGQAALSRRRKLFTF